MKEDKKVKEVKVEPVKVEVEVKLDPPILMVGVVYDGKEYKIVSANVPAKDFDRYDKTIQGQYTEYAKVSLRLDGICESLGMYKNREKRL